MTQTTKEEHTDVTSTHKTGSLPGTSGRPGKSWGAGGGAGVRVTEGPPLGSLGSNELKFLRSVQFEAFQPWDVFRLLMLGVFPFQK